MVGIIPARAGFTNLPTFSVLNNGDHPRSRGVYRMSRKTVPACDGSSPLARGLPRVLLGQLRQSRIIPARAGFTRVRTAPRPRPQDHPRSRGVYGLSPAGDMGVIGSSPLARGLPSSPCQSRSTLWDHPRSRGVYALRRGLHRAGVGSSPLARGLPRLQVGDRREGGIIPARAGFTSGCGA